MTYEPAADRYDRMIYRRCGRSGLLLPAISLGLWQNFGERPAARDEPRDRAARVRPRRHALRPRQQLRAAVRLGRGELRPAPAQDLAPVPRRARHLDEGRLRHVAGPVRRLGARASTCSRASTRASRRMGLDYVDIFYSHRVDPDTPLEETMGALDTAVRAGQGALRRHLVVLGRADRARRPRSCASSGTPLLIHQPSYSMLNRWIERGACSTSSATQGIGCIVFSPLAQGMLTDRYLDGIPDGSRASRGGSLSPDLLTRADAREDPRARTRSRRRRGQTLAQMALAWTLRDPRVTSTLVGASSVAQLEANVARARPPRLHAPTSSPRSTATRPTAASTSGPDRATHEHAAHPALRPARHPRADPPRGDGQRPRHARAGGGRHGRRRARRLRRVGPDVRRARARHRARRASSRRTGRSASTRSSPRRPLRRASASASSRCCGRSGASSACPTSRPSPRRPTRPSR